MPRFVSNYVSIGKPYWRKQEGWAVPNAARESKSVYNRPCWVIDKQQEQGNAEHDNINQRVWELHLLFWCLSEWRKIEPAHYRNSERYKVNVQPGWQVREYYKSCSPAKHYIRAKQAIQNIRDQQQGPKGQHSANLLHWNLRRKLIQELQSDFTTRPRKWIF